MKRAKRGIVGGVILAGLVLCPIGCGSTSQSNLTGPTSGSALNLVSSPRVMGQVLLAGAIDGAKVELQSLNGQILAQDTTDPTGLFQFPGDLAVPTDFRAVATLANGDRFVTEVRGYAGAGRYVVINVPTSLISAYMQAEPSLSLPEASKKVGAFLGFQEMENLEYGVGESSISPFSHLEFFARAIRNGGWMATRDRLIGQIQAGTGTAPFALDLTTLEADFSSLDPSLRKILDQLRQAPGFRNLAITAVAERSSQNLSQLAEGLSAQAQARAMIEPVLAKLVGTIRHIGGQTSTAGLQSVGWSHILDALNYNYGTTELVEANQDILRSLLSLASAANGGNVNSAALQKRVDAVIDLANRLANINGGSDGIGGTPYSSLLPAIQNSGTDLNNPRTPKTVPADVATLTADIVASTDYEALLTDLKDVARGNNGQPSAILAGRDKYNLAIGTVGTANTGYFPMTSENLVCGAINSYNYYAAVQQITALLLAEKSHMTSTTPADDINHAANVLLTAANELKLQLSQMPLHPLAPGILIDVQGGLMWRTSAFGQSTLAAARQFADSYTITGRNGHVYDDWRLPSAAEMSLLQDRGRLSTISGVAPASSPDEYPEVGATLQGLVGLGFDEWSFSGVVGPAGNLWCDSWDYSSKDQAFQQTTGYYAINTDDFLGNDRFHKDTDPSSIQPFFLVRNLGKPVVIEDSDAPSGASPYAYTPLAADEFSTLGFIEAITDAQLFRRAVPGVTTLWRVITGGSFQMGVPGASDSRNFPIVQQDTRLNTYPGGDYPTMNPIEPNTIVALESNSSRYTIGAASILYYHNDNPNPGSYPVSFNGSTVSRTGQFIQTPNAGSPITPPLTVASDISIVPRNRIYNLSGAASRTENYTCLAYMSDNTVRDVSSSAIWTVTRSDGQPSTSASFQGNQLRLNNSGSEAIVIQATYNSFIDSCTGQVNP